MFAEMSVLAEVMASACDLSAGVGLTVANFRNRSVAVALSSALDGSAFGKAGLSALFGCAVGEALGGQEFAIVLWVWDFISAV